MVDIFEMGKIEFKEFVNDLILEMKEEACFLGKTCLFDKPALGGTEIMWNFLYDIIKDMKKLRIKYRTVSEVVLRLEKLSNTNEEQYLEKQKGIEEDFIKIYLRNKRGDHNLTYRHWMEIIYGASLVIEYYWTAVCNEQSVEDMFQICKSMVKIKDRCQNATTEGYTTEKNISLLEHGVQEREKGEKPKLMELSKVEHKKNGIDKEFPLALKAHLDQYVVGQEMLKKKMCMVMYNYLLKRSNDNTTVLMIGDTGSGKNYMIDTLKAYDPIGKKLPVLIYDCSKLTPNGFAGESVVDIFKQFKTAARSMKVSANRGIIYLDEFSKIVMANHSSTGEDVNVLVQYQLISALSGTIIEDVDTNGLLFILGGCFEDLNELRKKDTKRAVGFSAKGISTTDDKMGRKKTIRDELLSIGVRREFLGRVTSIVEMQKLDETQLKEILLNDHGLLTKKQAEFALDDLQLVFPDEVIDEVVRCAVKENLGARSVQNIVEEMVGSYSFDMIANGYNTLVMHKEVLLGEPPLFERR